MSQIHEEEVEHLAKLSRIYLSDGEKKNFTHQIDEILGYVKKVGEFAKGEAENKNFYRLKNVIREDSANNLSVFEMSENQRKLLKNAPDKEDNFFKVPGVFEG